jgi:uncharacterized protein (TIGR02145 family)
MERSPEAVLFHIKNLHKFYLKQYLQFVKSQRGDDITSEEELMKDEVFKTKNILELFKKFEKRINNAGRKLKSELVWDVPGENLFSFGAFPVGFRYPWGEYGGDFCGQLSCFWSIDSKEDTHAKGINMQNDDKIDTRDFIARYPKGQGRSIRLIKL